MTGVRPRVAGPLAGLGPAVRSCLIAGIPGISIANAPELRCFEEEESLITREGLAPVALRLLDATPEFHDSPIRERFYQAANTAEMNALAADLTAQPFLRKLIRLEVTAVIIKGPAVARFHPHGWPRPYSDLDILVPSSQFDAVMRAAISEGYLYPEYARPPWPWVDRYCREGVNLHGRGNIDIHHHVPPWVFGARLGAEEVADSGERAGLYGEGTRLASREHSAVIAALHVLNDLWKGRLGLLSWRDVVVLFQSGDPARLKETFGDLELGWLLDLIAVALRSALPDAKVDISGNEPLPLGIAWRMRVLGWDRTTSLTRHRGAWVARLPWRQAVAFLAASTVPSPSYIRERHGSYPRYWLRAWRETLSTISGADFRRVRMSPNKDR